MTLVYQQIYQFDIIFNAYDTSIEICLRASRVYVTTPTLKLGLTHIWSPALVYKIDQVLGYSQQSSDADTQKLSMAHHQRCLKTRAVPAACGCWCEYQKQSARMR